MSASCASVWTVQLDPPFVEYSTVTYAVDPELFAKDNVEVLVPPPVEHVPKLCDAVRLTAVGSLAQSEASTDIVTLVVPEEGVRKPYVLLSAYQFNWTDVPLACAGTESEVLLAPPFTLAPVVRFDVLPPIVYVLSLIHI